MITTFLVEHRWVTTASFWIAVVAGPVLAYWIAPRRRVAFWMGLAAVAVVAGFTLFPTSRDLQVGCAMEWAVPTFGKVELMANIVLFVPVVLFLGVAARRPWVVFGAASVASLGLEAFQAVVPALGRSCSSSDWFSNSLGGLLGAVLAALVLQLHGRASQPPVVAGSCSAE